MSNGANCCFLKWAGGKRSILHEIAIRTPNYSGKYIEPFLGGGSVLFSQEIDRLKLVNDRNAELVSTYEVVRDDPSELIASLRSFSNTKNEYYAIRAIDRSPEFSTLSKIDRAARFIYLNKTCYNGLYRVNSRGEFNVPFGNYAKPDIVSEKAISAAHEYLSHKTKGVFTTQLVSLDYKEVLLQAAAEDFVYLDPPYIPLSITESFVSYTSGGFGFHDQLELRDLLVSIKTNGTKILMSNSDTDFIRHEYEGEFNELFKVERGIFVKRTVGASASSRKKAQEVFIS